MQAEPALFVAVLNWNSGAAAADCVRSIRASAGVRPHIVVVDNGSSDDSVPALHRLDPPPVVIQCGVNTGYSGGMNRALEHWLRDHPTEFALLLTQDVTVQEDTLLRLLRGMESDPRAGIIGPIVRNESGEIFSAGGRIDPKRTRVRQYRAPLSDGIYPGDWIDGCAMLLRREVAERFRFDPRYFLYFEEVDLCLRARREGWRVLVEPLAGVTQVKPALPGAHYFFFNARNRFLFWREHFERRFFRVALSLVEETAGVAWWCVRTLARPREWPQLPLRLRRLQRQIAGSFSGARAWIQGSLGPALERVQLPPVDSAFRARK